MSGAPQDGEKAGTVPGLTGPAFLSTAVCGSGVLTLALVGALALGRGDPVVGQGNGIVVRSPLTIVADGNRAPSLGTTTPAFTGRTPARARAAGGHQAAEPRPGQGGQGRSAGPGPVFAARLSGPTRPAPPAETASGMASGGSTPQYVPPPNGGTVTGSGRPRPSSRPHPPIAVAAHPCRGLPVTAPGPGAHRRGAGQGERSNRTTRVSTAVYRPGSAHSSHPGSGPHSWRGQSARTGGQARSGGRTAAAHHGPGRTPPAETRSGLIHQWTPGQRQAHHDAPRSRDHHQQRDITAGGHRHRR